MLEFERFTHLSFDCYGTLIDWEAGILEALAPVLTAHGITAEEERLLRLYARQEAKYEAGPFKPYRRLLCDVMADIASDLGFQPTEEERATLANAVGRWPPFPDTVAALKRLTTGYSLAILSNVDDDLFAETERHLGIQFDRIITAEQVGSYKPSLQNFRQLLTELSVPAHRVLHIAQSLYHDHRPAKALGLHTVWVDRDTRLSGTGVSLPAQATPDLKVPDLASLVTAMGL